MKLILLFLIFFQSIQDPIDYYFDSSKAIIHVLYKNKTEKYNVENGFQLISSNEIKNSDLYDLRKFKFINQNQLSSSLGGRILEFTGDSVLRIDNSFEHKMQIGSLEFKRNDTILRYGGYGFFENRNFFTFYDKQTNGWEVLNIKGDVLPERISDFLSHRTKDKLFIFGGYKFDNFKKDIKYQNTNCYEFDFNSKKWEIIGSLNNHFTSNNNNNTSFLYDDNNLIIFQQGKLYKVNYESNLVESFFSNPITKKIQSSVFKPFIHKGQLHYFNMKDDQLEVKSITLKNFEISLKGKDKKNLYETSYWVYLMFLILIIISTTLIFFLLKKFRNKIIKIHDLYFFNLKKIPLNNLEETLFIILFKYSKSNTKVENRIITDIFEDETLNYGTINRKKNESINKLDDKLKIIFKTNRNIIIRESSEVDKREINYFINPKFI